MLGREISGRLAAKHTVIAPGKEDLDVTCADSVRGFFNLHKPEAVIHCAAMTAVDACETYREEAFKVNAAGSLNIASACRAAGAKLIAVSTDYVFGGQLERPYNEYDKPEPKTVYGKSKLAGEENIRLFCSDHIILRTSWLYGSGGPSFLHTMLKLAGENKPVLKVVGDQIGNPTSAEAVAAGIGVLLEKPYISGTFHFSCEGECSWFDFASEIFRLKGISQRIEKCSTSEFPRPAARPKNSSLDKMNLRLWDLPPMPFWKDALKCFLLAETL